MPKTTEVGKTNSPGKEVGMFQAVIKFIRPAGPGANFERYLQNLQRLDASGAPTREQAKRDFREFRSADPYSFNTRN